MKIRYFAWLRERLNRGEEDIDPPAEVRTVSDLIAWLRQRDEAADLALADPSLLRVAIDARMVKHDAPLAGATIVALLPPMTGG